MESSGLMQIGEFAKVAGTNLRTVRYYEELGLVAPTLRSAGGFRFYNQQQLERVRAIKKLQSMGLSLAEIGTIMNPRRGCQGERLAEVMTGALRRQREAILARIEEYKAHLKDVDDALGKLGACRGCDIDLDLHCDPCSKDGQPLPASIKALL